MLEVELKARADLDAAARRLEALGKMPPKTSVKEDVYYCGPGVDPRTCNVTKERIVRVRIEAGQAVVTAKRKKIEHGVETSEEIELTASSAAAFRDLLGYMGYRAFLNKRKETRAYAWSEGVTVELNRIAGLGEFVEIEALVPLDAPAAEVDAARRRIRAILGELGIDEGRIEPRPYVELLRERGVGLEE